MIQRILGLIIFLSAVFLGYTTYVHYESDIEWITASPGKRIALIIESDFKKLAKGRELPDEWKRILRVNYKMNSPVAQALMGDERPQLREIFDRQTSKKENTKNKPEQKSESRPDVQFEAEVEVIDLPDDKVPGFILQISLINLDSKNKIFEIGRTYYLYALNKKKPD